MWKKITSLAGLSRPIEIIWKRHYNMKKLSNLMDKNPYVQKIVEEQAKKREKRATLDRLIEKR